MNEQNNTLLFPQGNKLSNEWFSGDAFLMPLLPKDKNNEFALGSITFESGARTHWHTHPKGQVLIVTDGEGMELLLQAKWYTLRLPIIRTKKM